jgi:glutamate transport system permease protein
MRKTQVMTLILLPQAVRRMLPVLIAQLVVLLKDTSLGFIIGYFELLRGSRSLVEFLSSRFGDTYTFQIYVAAAVIYIVINVLLSQLARIVERRTRRSAKAAGPPEHPEELETAGPDAAVGGIRTT